MSIIERVIFTGDADSRRRGPNIFGCSGVRSADWILSVAAAPQ